MLPWESYVFHSISTAIKNFCYSFIEKGESLPAELWPQTGPHADFRVTVGEHDLNNIFTNKNVGKNLAFNLVFPRKVGKFQQEYRTH
jgi:hypothetical protein